MQKAIFSRVDLTSDNDLLAKEFVSCIQDLIEVDDVQELKAFSQHMDTSRFQHSLNVSYYSFLFAPIRNITLIFSCWAAIPTPTVL